VGDDAWENLNLSVNLNESFNPEAMLGFGSSFIKQCKLQKY
jgi:hypothetical protein